MATEYAVFARAHTYDPEDFDPDTVAVVAFSQEAEARSAFELYANPERLQWKNAFLLEVETEGDYDVNDADPAEFDASFRTAFPDKDVAWASDLTVGTVDGKVKGMKILESNFRETFPEDEGFNPDDPSFEDLGDDLEGDADMDIRSILVN